MAGPAAIVIIAEWKVPRRVVMHATTPTLLTTMISACGLVARESCPRTTRWFVAENQRETTRSMPLPLRDRPAASLFDRHQARTVPLLIRHHEGRTNAVAPPRVFWRFGATPTAGNGGAAERSYSRVSRALMRGTVDHGAEADRPQVRGGGPSRPTHCRRRKKKNRPAGKRARIREPDVTRRCIYVRHATNCTSPQYSLPRPSRAFDLVDRPFVDGRDHCAGGAIDTTRHRGDYPEAWTVPGAALGRLTKKGQMCPNAGLVTSASVTRQLRREGGGRERKSSRQYRRARVLAAINRDMTGRSGRGCGRATHTPIASARPFE